MSDKKTYFHDGRIKQGAEYLASWEGEHAKADDATLPHELAAIIQDARVSYFFKKTPAGDCKETLRGLSLIMDDTKIKQAAQVMDDFTKSHLCTAAGLMWRKESPDTKTPVPGTLFNIKTWTPEHIRIVARYALKTLREKTNAKKSGGRTPTRDRDVQFAARLAAYWQKTERKEATVTIASATKKESAFVIFAVDKFQRAGRFVSPSALEDVLRQGCKLTYNRETHTI